MGSRDGWGRGGVVEGKWRQLFVNNNKKCEKNKSKNKKLKKENKDMDLSKNDNIFINQ